MTTWIIEPRDPLIVRDGRPFGPDPGARAKSLPFPYPSTITGGVRTRAGQDVDGVFPKSDEVVIEKIKKIGVRGPLLVELDNLGEIRQWLFPAPADALLFPASEIANREVACKQLFPLKLLSGVQTDLPDDLWPVGLLQPDSRKPFKNPPSFWFKETFMAWLMDPADYATDLAKLGHSGPVTEQRIHVSINQSTMTAEEGALFLTSGLEFSRTELEEVESLAAARLGLALETEASLREGLAPLGGERRLMQWRQSKSMWPALPESLKDLKERIVRDKACRLILATPAYFEGGYRPRWLVGDHEQVKVKIKAVAVRRPQVVSGWDLAQGRPKPSRRLAPAGSVYFLVLDGKDDAIESWVDSMWMGCVSDTEEERLAGFGLALLGTWSGKQTFMEA